jgi:hypothetical protein
MTGVRELDDSFWQNVGRRSLQGVRKFSKTLESVQKRGKLLGRDFALKLLHFLVFLYFNESSVFKGFFPAQALNFFI